MNILASKFLDGIKKKLIDNRSKYIFYKIVEESNARKGFLLQCINTKAIFRASLVDIVHDIDLLYGLHPIQACFIGFEYANYLKRTAISNPGQSKSASYSKHPWNRYGKFAIHFQDRNNNICFIDKYSKKEFIMDPRDIALSSLIEEFDASAAFLVGMVAGNKINRSKCIQHALNKNQDFPRLKLIK